MEKYLRYKNIILSKFFKIKCLKYDHDYAFKAGIVKKC